jgi:hypothetical protein
MSQFVTSMMAVQERMRNANLKVAKIRRKENTPLKIVIKIIEDIQR